MRVKAIALVSLFLLSSAAVFVSTEAHSDYDCLIKKVFTVDDEGIGSTSFYEDVYLGYTLVYDDDAGTIDICKQDECRRGWSEMEIVQQSSSENSLIALQVRRG